MDKCPSCGSSKGFRFSLVDVGVHGYSPWDLDELQRITVFERGRHMTARCQECLEKVPDELHAQVWAVLRTGCTCYHEGSADSPVTPVEFGDIAKDLFAGRFKDGDGHDESSGSCRSQ